MYKQYKRSVESVGEVVERSLTNLSVTDLRLRKDVPEERESDGELTEEGTKKMDVSDIVQDCWSEICRQCVDDSQDLNCSSRQDDLEWKSIRVFVSSTFTDFFCEREVLVKKVFPKLREWCRVRKLYLIDCDLRWGVPQDSTTANTIAVCLEELDRCIADTAGEPFFLNMLGEKYGWIPSMTDIPEELKQKYKWIPNTSMTFMEILHGAYRKKNQNALFLLRDSCVMSDIPDHLMLRYASTEELDKQHLKQLKAWLPTRFPGQVFEYNCQVEGTVTKHGKEIANIVGLEDFCSHVESFFHAAIQRMFPNRGDLPQTAESKVLMETGDQQKFMEEMCVSMVGREREMQLLLSYVKGDTDKAAEGSTEEPFARDPEYWQELSGTGNTLLCVQGQPGHGKTVLLAKLAQQAVQRYAHVFYHFCGGTGLSYQLEILLQRLVAFLKNDFSREYLQSLYECNNDKLTDLIKEQLVTMATKDQEDIILIIDGLDQLSSANSVKHLRWLPPKFPKNVRCVISCSSHPPTLRRIQEHQHYIVTLDTLLRQDAKKIVEVFLGKFSKTLETRQLQMILDAACSQSPLWLYLVCEELRVYGDFRTLSSQVKALTTSLEAGIQCILDRLVSEDETGCLKKTLCILACSYGPLTVLDLQRMLGNLNSKEPVGHLIWAQVRTSLGALLRISNFNEQITFVHDKIRTVTDSAMFDESLKKLEYHTLLSDYLENWCEDVYLKSEFLPQHLMAARLKKRLVNFLRTSPAAQTIPGFRRSLYISNYRCRNLADPVVRSVRALVICQFCKLSRAVYNSCNFFFNQNMCVVCGNMVHGVPQQRAQAHLCHFHSCSYAPNMTKCFLCDKVTLPNQTVPAKLCHHCSFGVFGKSCALLDLC